MGDFKTYGIQERFYITYYISDHRRNDTWLLIATIYNL